MSKRRFTLMALVAVFVLAFASGAFAAPETSWRGSDGATWDSDSNWTNGAPTEDTLAVFPNTTKTVRIGGPDNVAGAIRIDSGTEQVRFEMDEASILRIRGYASKDNLPNDVPGIWAQGHALFTGGGTVVASEDRAAAQPSRAFEFVVAEGMTLEFNVVVSSDTPIVLRKQDKGTLAFTSNQDNKFDVTTAAAGFVIQDGEVQIARQGHINAGLELYYDTNRVQGRTAVLTSLWTNVQGWNEKGKLVLSSDGTLNVPAGSFRITSSDLVAPEVVDLKDRALTKAGAGTFLLAQTNVLTGTYSDAALNIAAGSVNITATDALRSGDINVAIAADANLTVDRDIVQRVAGIGGEGELNLAEFVDFAITDDSEFDGYITGYGSIRIGDRSQKLAGRRPTVAITGAANDFGGDTIVTLGSKLTIDHANNLGGTKGGKVYLEPTEAANSVVTRMNYDTTAFSRLEIAEGFSGIMPNEIQIASYDVTASTMGGNNSGSVVIDVPADTRFEIANNITFSQNTIAKAGEGEIVFSSAGQASIGNGSFVTDTPGSMSVALHIVNGLAEIRNANALDVGDIVVDAGGYRAGRAALRILNGLTLKNAIYFTQNSTFDTTLKEANLNVISAAEGIAAVRVGQVAYSYDYQGNKPSPLDPRGRVYNRVGFEQLPNGTVTKGQQFFLMESTQYDNYRAQNITPVRDDAQMKAMFDPAISNYFVTFTSLYNIDVPALGAPSATAARFDMPFSITIPVTSTTGLLAGSPTVIGLGDGARATASGNNVVISGPAREVSGDVTYRVSVTTNGEVPDTVGYETYADYTITFNETGAPGQPPVAEPSVTAPAMTVDTPAPAKGATVTFTLGSWTFKAADGTETPYPWNDALVTYTSATVTNGTLVTTEADVIAKTANTIQVKVNEDAADGATVTLTVNATVNGVAGTMTGTATVPSASGPGGEDPVVPDNGSSGCDAGFGAFALLAVAGALVLRKKD